MSRVKNIFEKFILAYMAGMMVFASLFFALPANAQPSYDTGLNPLAIKEKVEEGVNKPLSVVIIQVLLNLISFVANRLAYDAAIAIASGGPGQSPGYEYRSIEEYGQDLFEDILGESIGQLSGTLGDIGVNFDICAPSDPTKRLNLQLGIAGIAGSGSRPEPKCEFRSITSNWEGFIASAADNANPDKIFKDFATQFTSGGTDLSASIIAIETTINRAAEQKVIKSDELLANERFNDVSDVISGNVKTPSTVLQDQFKNKLNASQDNQSQALQDSLFGNEGALLQVGVSAGSVFLNTLLSQLTSKIYSGLFEPPTTGGVFNPEFIDVGGRAAAREQFKGLLVSPISSIPDYNVVNDEFLACPGGSNRGPNNCVMDAEFGALVSRASAGDTMTVREAIDAGLLHGDWPLISPEDTARNEDPFCYTYGYCHANLVKMRIARIIPVGWELAALKAKQVQGSVTLNTVVDGFDDCNDANPASPIGAANPWCHLIDPNWVIKYPETQCKANVTGATLLAENASTRHETCVDAPSCIEEDENGNCIGGYGYCTRERNAWRFDGDSCPAQFASCLTLTSRTGDTDSVLTTTVDYAGCDADNAGCTWYNTVKELNDGGTALDPTDDTFVFDTVLDLFDDATPTLSVADENSRQYFTASATACGNGDDGCTELVRASEGTLNPVRNPSFEQDSDQDGIPDYWVTFAPANYLQNFSSSAVFGSNFQFGEDVVELNTLGAVETRDPIHLYPNQFVTVSMTAISDATFSSDVDMRLLFTDGEGLPIFSGSPLMPTPTVTTDCTDIGVWLELEVQNVPDDALTRYGCTFSTPNEDVWMSISIQGDGGPLYLDAIQVDEAEVTSAFHSGYSSRDLTNMKLAPEYLNCTGNPSDNALCANYAQVCSAAEVGCTAYTPSNGNPTVPGIVNANDYCSNECVGYETYRQLETNFADDLFPVYLIADSAQSCPAQYNGCSEFTNLDGLSEGGETLQYFTDVRVCQEVQEAAATNTPGEVFYTWEGSDSAGFQLITWTLKGSDASALGGPCQNFNATTGACEDSTNLVLPIPDCSVHADIFTNPDCREFYDTDGDIHYRLFSDTVTVDNACSPFRKTLSNITDCTNSSGVWNTASGNCTYNIMPSESLSCPAAQNGCRGYVGNTGNNTRIAFSEYFESGTLADWSATPLSAPTAVSSVLYYSNESVATDGHSMQVPPSAHAIPVDGQIQDGYEYLISFWAKGSGTLDVELTDGTNDAAFVTSMALTQGWQEYTLGPLNPALVNPAIAVDDSYLVLSNANSISNPVFIDNIILREVQDTSFLIENSWVTPSTCDQTPSGAPAPQFQLGCTEYDTHTGDQVNLKSFTSICREAAIGCEGFYDTKNSTSEHPQAFNLVCNTPVDSAGNPVPTPVTALSSCEFNGEEVCTVLVGQSECKFNYMGIDQPGALILNVEDDSEIVNRDEKIFIVDRPDVHCQSDAAGCTELGLPEFNIDKTEVVGFESVFLIDDPDQYDTTLCTGEDLFCEAYSTQDGSNYYFKNPGPQTCSWREEVLISGTGYFGWFRSDTDEPCYYTPVVDDGIFDPSTELGSAYLIGGIELGVWRNGDVGYGGWVAQCNAKWNQCSEFLDVADTSDGVYPEGKPYNFIKNEKIDEADKSPAEKCNGLISQEQGCIALNDASISTIDFSSSASYIKSRYAHRIQELNKAQFAPVTPVSCPYGGEVTIDGNTVDLCSSRCAYSLVSGLSGSTPVEELFVGSSCFINSDCGTIDDVFGAATNGTCVNFDDPTSSDPIAVVPAGICVGGALSGTLCTPSGGGCGTGVCQDVSVSTDPSTNNDGGTISDDSNTILKVRRDRSCSEWLACDAGFTAFDERQNKNVQVCNSVALCNEFSTSGDNTFCSNWTEQPLEVLTETEYARRDVTWYGSEFSGYSIPNQYPVEEYTQVNLNPSRWCILNDQVFNSAGTPIEFDVETATWTNNSAPGACTATSDCNALVTGAKCESAPDDYRLGVTVGPCAPTTSNGDVCIVGFCSDSGLACAIDDQCSGTATCNTATTANKIGICYNGGCVQNVEGENFTALNAVRSECRAYPEEGAPFPRAVVTQEETAANRGDTGTTELWEDRALSRRQGFNHVNLCANGEDCECSYKKAEYGLGAKNLYFGPNQTLPAGICSGGLWDGLECTKDWECKQSASGTRPTTSGDVELGAGGGVCEFKTTENTYIGWNGLCLQRDGAIRVNGSSDERDENCLLWLPVDQLVGGTDIYGKFTEAGFSIANTTHCTETGLFVDVYVNGAVVEDGEVTNINYSCAESLGPGGRSPAYTPGIFDPIWFAIQAGIQDADLEQYPGEDPHGDNGGQCESGEWDNCWSHVTCPKNSYAIIGACDDSGDTCNQTGGPEVDNDCPYMCIPIGSRASQDDSSDSISFNKGDLCSPPDSAQYVTDNDVTWLLDTMGLSETQKGYFVTDITGYEAYKSCVLQGVEFTPFDASTMNVTQFSNLNEYYLPLEPNTSTLFRGHDNNVDFYLGCSEVSYTAVEPGYSISTEGSTFGNSAWTNRTLTPGDQYTITADPDGIGTKTSTTPEVVGQVQLPYEFEQNNTDKIIDAAQADGRPAIAEACLYANSITTKSQGQSCIAFPENTPAEARSYDRLAVTIPAMASGGGGVCDATVSNDCSAGSTSCEDSPSTSTFTCFIECSQTALAENTAPNGAVALDITDGDAWCQSLGLGACQPTTVDSPETCTPSEEAAGCVEATYICQKYYGKWGSNDQSPGSTAGQVEDNSMGTNSYSSSGACSRAYTAGVIAEGDSGWNNQADLTYQCAGSGGGDSACLADSDCPGYLPPVTCVDDDGDGSGYCEVTQGSVGDVVPEIIDEGIEGGGITLLKQFFAKIYSRWGWDSEGQTDVDDDPEESGGYIREPDTSSPADIRSAGDTYGTGPNNGSPGAPVIRGLGTTCVNDNCSEGPANTITVNGSLNQTYSSENSFLTDLRFFATTDPNHFPLRNVIVDWGDGFDTSWDPNTDKSVVWGRGSESGSIALDNYYKARRGLDASDLTNITPICSADTEWGETADSCEDGPFQFIHHYRCTAGMQNWLQSTGRACVRETGTNKLLNSPCWDNACVFQPRVHVVDNWEYCSGACGDTDGDGFADGVCYGRGADCKYDTKPTASNQLLNPWINYGGEIHVSP